MVRTARLATALSTLCCAFLTACGGGPPDDVVHARVTDAVLNANTAVFQGTAADAEVVAIDVGSWKTETMPQGPTRYEATWTARLRFTQPLACILAEVDGKNVVRVVADAGDELAFAGRCGATYHDGEWEVAANARSDYGPDMRGAGGWQPIVDKAGGLTMGYPVFRDGASGTPKFRRSHFATLNRLQPCVVEGSPEHRQLEAETNERFEKARAAAAEKARQRQEAAAAQREAARQAQEERQRQQTEAHERAQAEAAEKQRLALEEQQRQRAEAAERARVAKEEAAAKAAADKHARLLAVLQPFRSPAGAVVVAEAGFALGTVALEPVIDEKEVTVSGRALDLREMPFQELTFRGAVDERGRFTWTDSRGGAAVAYRAAGEKLTTRGSTIAALSTDERAQVDALIALGTALGKAAPATLSIETLDAEQAKAREPQLQLAGLTGTVFHKGRAAPAVANLFAADLGANRAYVWRNGEVVAIRLQEPVKGTGLYLRGGSAPSTEFSVQVNGVHTVTVPAVPKLGGVVVALPADLEVLEVQLRATGTVSLRTIGLTK